MDDAVRKRVPGGINPAAIVWSVSATVVLVLVAFGEGAFDLPEREEGAAPVAPRIEFAHPLSTQLDDMMRTEAEVLVVGDPDFVARMRAAETLGDSVHYLELPQVDLYAHVAVYQAILQSRASMVVMESIPAYWGGQVSMAEQPPAAAVQAALDQVPGVEPTSVAAPPAPGGIPRDNPFFGNVIPVGPRIEFAHPLSTQLDDMMRTEAELLVVGDPRFVAPMRAAARSITWG